MLRGLQHWVAVWDTRGEFRSVVKRQNPVAVWVIQERRRVADRGPGQAAALLDAASGASGVVGDVPTHEQPAGQGTPAKEDGGEDGAGRQPSFIVMVDGDSKMAEILLPTNRPFRACSA